MDLYIFVKVVLLKLYRWALVFLLTMVSFLMNDLKPVRLYWTSNDYGSFRGCEKRY